MVLELLREHFREPTVDRSSIVETEKFSSLESVGILPH
jgi:hypothetical protein